MKVTNVITIHVDRFMYVKVETDEGITGIGELHPASGTGGTPYLPIAGVAYCAEYLVGQDPLPIERHWQHLFRRCLFRGGADVMATIGAIDMALWDIKGKAFGKPVYELLGGPTRRRVPALYPSGRHHHRGLSRRSGGLCHGRVHRRAPLPLW